MKNTIGVAVALLASTTVFAQTQVPHTFQAGQAARAAEVNANFDELESAINLNASSISELQQGAGAAEPGSIGLVEIDPSEVQVRVGGSCAVGSFVAAVAEDGSVTCGAGTTAGPLFNTRYGTDALFSNTTGQFNNAIGYQALKSNTTGSGNSAIGYHALYLNTTGADNTASGTWALEYNTIGNHNTAFGYDALSGNTSGSFNTANGRSALRTNTIGYNNTAMGYEALKLNSEGTYNIAVGNYALYQNTNGRDNVAIGGSALGRNRGSNNIAVGSSAGLEISSGNYNIMIGHRGEFGDTQTTRIGSNQTRTFVAGIYGASVVQGVNVVVNSAGHLGTITSSRRYKKDIQDMGDASERLLQLHPVTFRYKEAYAKGEQPLDYGLIAEEVAEVFPELVVYNEKGQPETVKYRLLSTLLLNELQKQDRELVSLKGQVAELNQLVQRMAQLNGLITGESVARHSVE